MPDTNALGDQNKSGNTSDVKSDTEVACSNIENTTPKMEEIIKVDGAIDASNTIIMSEPNVKIENPSGEPVNLPKLNCAPEVKGEEQTTENQTQNIVPKSDIISEIKNENAQNVSCVKSAVEDKQNTEPSIIAPDKNIIQCSKSQEEEKVQLQKNTELERIQNENANLNTKLQNLERDLQVRTEERENYKNKVHMLETEVTELKNQQPNTLNSAQQNLVEKLKRQSEEILTRAKGVIFDKTKLIKHQELQIETLTLQIKSLKEVLSITKELLEIRNLEVKELQEKMNYMEQKINGEKLRHDLMNTKMDTMMQMNTDLKTEYQTQLQLFDQLRTHYSRREELQNEQGEASAQNEPK